MRERQGERASEQTERLASGQGTRGIVNVERIGRGFRFHPGNLRAAQLRTNRKHHESFSI